MKALILSVFAVAVVSVFPAISHAIPSCNAGNEGQTLLLEDGLGGARVYVCSKGNWIPAEHR